MKLHIPAQTKQADLEPDATDLESCSAVHSVSSFAFMRLPYATMVKHDGRADCSIIYLNNAGQAPLPESTKKAGIDAVQRSPRETSADDVDRSNICAMFATLIGAHQTRIAIMPSTAFAITLAANNVLRTTKQRRGKVLVLQDEMCSEVYAWQDVCERSNGRICLDIVPYPTNDGGWTEAVLNRLDDDVIAAGLPQVHWSDGALLDLESIGAACREHDTILIVDATQSIGVMPLDVNTIEPTMVACSVHKWLRGPAGMSLVYVSQEVQDEWSPLDQHGRSRAVAIDNGSSWDAAKNEMGPKGYPFEFVKDARKFDSGGKPNPILLPMLRASLEKVVQLDVCKVQDDLKHLTAPIIQWAAQHSFCLTPGPHAGHLIGIRPSPDQLTPSQMIEITNLVRNEGIYIVVRCGAFRVSPYIDIEPSDIECLLDALARYCKV